MVGGTIETLAHAWASGMTCILNKSSVPRQLPDLIKNATRLCDNYWFLLLARHEFLYPTNYRGENRKNANSMV